MDVVAPPPPAEQGQGVMPVADEAEAEERVEEDALVVFVDLNDDNTRGEDEEEETHPRRDYIIPPEMHLTRVEEDWAWELVQEVESGGSHGLKPLTDFEYAAWALVAGGNVEVARRQIRGIQQFREWYNVQDTVEEGMTVLEDFIRLQPRFLLHADVMGPFGSTAAWNFGAFMPERAMVSEETWRIHALFFYYISRIHQPTLEVIRGGASYSIQGTMSWENVDTNFLQQMDEEIFMYDAIKCRQVMVYNTNSIAHIAYSLAKRTIPANVRHVVMFGPQIDHVLHPFGAFLTLEDIHFQPSYEVAMERLLQRSRGLLEVRFRHQENYHLVAK